MYAYMHFLYFQSSRVNAFRIEIIRTIVSCFEYPHSVYTKENCHSKTK